VIGLSGGMDSATLLGFLLEQGYEVHCCVFNYGSKHNAYENKAALDVAEYYKKNLSPVFVTVFDLREVFKPFESNLLLSGGEIPEGHYADENMKKTVVPGRNMIFAAIMAGIAESIQAEAIALGVHSGDHSIYPDCRPEFIKALDTVIFLSSDKKVQVLTPFITDNKTSILEYGYNYTAFTVPYHLTRTCYKDQAIACGKCGSCVERLEAFANINQTDPVPYAK